MADNGMRGRSKLPLVALASLVAAATLVYVVRGSVPLAAMVLGFALSLVGLFALLAWQFGLLNVSSAEARLPLLDAVADAIGDAAVVTDARGLAVYANTAYLTLAATANGSARAGRLVGMDVLYSGYPDFAEAVYQLAQSAKDRKAQHRDVRVAASSSVPGAHESEAKWLRVSVSPSNGGHVLWRLTDITADRASQESAFSRLQFIITYLDHAPAGFFSTLPEGNVDYVNATLAEWLGLDLADVQGARLPLSDLVGEETARGLKAIAPVAGGSRVDRFAVKLPLKSGGVMPATIFHRSDFDAEGKALPFRSMVLRADAALPAASGQLLPDLAAVAPVGLARVSADGTLQFANGVFLGLADQLRLHGPLSAGVAVAQRDNLVKALARALEMDEPQKLELDFGSTPRAVALTLARVPGLDDVVAFAVDRSEKRTLEVQLAQSQKMQAVGELASGIAHDFNNVLTPIIGFADLLLAKMRPTDAAFGDIMNIKQNANRAAQLVRQLLAFSRKQTMQPKLHLLNEAISEMGNLLGRALGEKVTLETNYARDTGHALVDINQFEQVLLNLAVNARDAMPKGGKLSVKTYNVDKGTEVPNSPGLVDGNYVVCEISDTGSGIPKEVIDRIWEPFFTTKDVGKGTGLGLSMVYGIVKQTGGFIFCDSEVGKGTTFRIYLQRLEPEAVVAPAEPVKAEPVRADFTGRGRILVVEDEDSVRAFAVRALTSRGYTVLEADSGESALTVIEDDTDGFELILSDVVMPEMDGPSLLAEIRKRGIKTKLIFMSGYAEEAFERNLENPDDFAFLQKPFSLKQLIEKVKEVMG